MGSGKGVAHVILVFNHIDNQLYVQMYDSNKPSSDSEHKSTMKVHVDEGPDKTRNVTVT